MLRAASRLRNCPARPTVATAAVSSRGPRGHRPGGVSFLTSLSLLSLVASAMLVLVMEVPAWAAPYAVKLDYQAGPDCPGVDQFVAGVQSRLGYDPFAENAPEKVLVLITSRGDALNGRVEWRDRHGDWAGEQGFPGGGTDCRRLVHAMGFALAVQIQILAATRLELDDGALPLPSPPAQGPAPVEPPLPVVASPLPPPPPPVAAPPVATPSISAPSAAPGAPNSGAVFALGAGGGAALGMSSVPSWSGRVFGSAGWTHLSVELAAALSVPDITRRADGAGYSQQFLFLAAAGCARVVRWSACLLSNVGQVRLHGEDIDRPTSANVPLVEVGVRAGTRQPLGRHVFWQAHLDGLANLNRWTATLDQVAVWTAPRFVASLGVEAGVWIP